MLLDDSFEERTLIDGGTVTARIDTQEALPSLTVLTGRDRGRVFGLGPGKVVVGRTGHAEVVLSDESVSRRHCEFTMDDQGGCTVRDLGSTNGTRVGGDRANGTPRRLEDGDRIRLSAAVLVKFSWQHPSEREMQHTLYNSAQFDELTGVYNKRHLLDRLSQEYSYARRNRRPLCLLIADIDHFKRINDTWGHETGDRVLQAVASFFTEVVRREDVVGRFGGEEFVVIMRDTMAGLAVQAAERLRAGLAELTIAQGRSAIQVTASLGVSSSEDQGVHNETDLFVSADRQMYRAKQSGRNRVCCTQSG